MKQTNAQKNFKKEMEKLQVDKNSKCNNKDSNIHYFNKKTYRDRLNEYFQKWFIYVFLPKWLPIILLIVIVLLIIAIN